MGVISLSGYLLCASVLIMPTYSPPSEQHPLDRRPTLSCHDCGQRTPQRRRNQKYCGLCRLGRDLIYWGDADLRERSCKHCKFTYLPLNRSDACCHLCAIKNPNVEGNCNLCNESTYLFHRGIPICWNCVKSRERRSEVCRYVVTELRQRDLSPERILVAHARML